MDQPDTQTLARDSVMMTPLNTNGQPGFSKKPSNLPGLASLLSEGERKLFQSLPDSLRQGQSGETLEFILAASKFSYPGSTKKLIKDVLDGSLNESDLFNLRSALTDHGRLQGLQSVRWRFIFQMLRAVSKYDATRPDLGVVCTALSEYRGTYAPLREVSLTVQRKRPNLIALPDRVEFIFPGPEALRSFGGAGKSTDSGMVRSASGQRILASKCVLAYDVHSPGKGSVLGIRSASNLAKLLKRIRELRTYSGESYSQTHADPAAHLKARKVLLNYSLAGAAAQAEPKEPSPHRSREPGIMEELREYRDQLRALLERGLRGENILEIGGELTALGNDRRRGALLRWIKSLDAEVPAPVLQAYRNLRHRNSIVQMSAEEEAVQWEILIFFKIQNTYLGASTLVETLREDERFLRGLSADDSLHSDAGRVLARLPDLDKARSGQEITIEHVGRILNLGLLDLRTKFGARALESTSPGLLEARSFIRELLGIGDQAEAPVFLPPWSKVKEHPAFLQRARGMTSHPKGELVLSRDDYEALARLAAAEVFCLGDDARLCRAFSIPQTQRLLEEAAFAGEKFACLRRAALDPEARLLTGSRWSHLSRSELRERLSAAPGGDIAPGEIVARGDSQQHKRKNWPTLNWPQLRAQCLLAEETGYFPGEELPALQSAAKEVSRLVSGDSPEMRRVISDSVTLMTGSLLASANGPLGRDELDKLGAESAAANQWFTESERDYVVLLGEVRRHLGTAKLALKPDEDMRWREIKDAHLISPAEAGGYQVKSAREIALGAGAVEFTAAEQSRTKGARRTTGYSVNLFPAAGVRSAIKEFAGADFCDARNRSVLLTKEIREGLGTRVRGLKGKKLYIRRQA